LERDALSALAALLDGLGIRWVLIGALAANRYRGSPRLTADLVAGTEYQQEAIRRARQEPLGSGATAAVLTAEDVVVHKLIAARSQERADVEAILATGIALDEEYVERWAAYWDVLEDWRSLRRSG
jgi:hypothetical protein